MLVFFVVVVAVSIVEIGYSNTKAKCYFEN